MTYDRRIKIFVLLSVFLLLVCLVRLVQMQLVSDSFYRRQIADLKSHRSLIRPLKTVRGRIIDRNGRVLAVDEPVFELCIDYQLTSFADQRVCSAGLLAAAEKKEPYTAVTETKTEIEEKLQILRQIIDKCTCFGLEPAQVQQRIESVNNRIWNLRAHLAAARNQSPYVQADDNGKLLLAAAVDIAEMHRAWPLLELKTDDDIFTAQLEFMNTQYVRIMPKANRVYPYNTAAAQIIGWVGPGKQPQDTGPDSENDPTDYVPDQLYGREDGVEYVCDALLRGRTGREVYDIDNELIDRTDIEFGTDVCLTLDIELQQRIERYLLDCKQNTNCKAPVSVVVIDVDTADILALVSLPVFDLNRVRYDYAVYANDPNEPLRNRAINKHYPPGSVIKPLILIAGLETGAIGPDEIISCPAQPAPRSWPNCWVYNRYHIGHDDKSPNNARNAVKGSCNIYFSHLADRIDAPVLQQWLFSFGYGRETLYPADELPAVAAARNLRQVAGLISSAAVDKDAVFTPQRFPLENREKRLFGIGQGTLRVAVLQVANAMAAIARGCIYKTPRLFLNDTENPHPEVTLGVSPQTTQLIRDGMWAVVNEYGGTAHEQFAYSGFAARGVNVYGKTGSTESPSNAWFAGFAEDSTGRAIALAVIVEGGRHGSSDAAPLARDIIAFAIEAGCIGRPN
ncbi:MAG TPA: penicillin-binding transpeptidase domain-containing protein [Sedimentisphaerales bacterium]|nr:penicillin-binding transpeptidase domain-containing protein [Sedimentisphaerales bacterium]